MTQTASGHIVVVGQGAAGLAAALAAAEAARAANAYVDIALIDKAVEDEAGGNTRWSPSNMRMASPLAVEPTFMHDMLQATNFQCEENYFARLAQEAPATVKWLSSFGIEFIQPSYYLAKGPPRIQPVGGGAAIIKALKLAAEKLGVTLLYDCTARKIVRKAEHISGLAVEQNGVRRTLPADAIVLACGGFEGNAAMMREHFGERAPTMRLISPGTHFNTGDGIRMAEPLGAQLSGDWHGMHAEPVDARSQKSAPVMLVYPYGIVVDQNGRRFFDEGAGLMHETWEWFAREMHFNAPGSTAFAILDSRLFDISDYQRAIRSELPPVSAATLDELAGNIGVDPANLTATVAAYNAACRGNPSDFDATRRDGLAAEPTLSPPKSNWARAINVPPFLAYPLVGAIAYTFGGLATDEHARVIADSKPIPGLFAAGEITGHFYATAPNAVAVLRALVFGRIAGREAAKAASTCIRFGEHPLHLRLQTSPF